MTIALSDLADLAATAEREIAAAADEAALDALRVRYVGRREGEITKALKTLPSLPAEQRPAFGAAANAARERIEAALERRGADLREAALARDIAGGAVDLTLPPRRVRVGRYHPISRTIREITRIFAGMGFEAIEGPEVEWDYYNFEALNIPPGHPARDKFSTLWVNAEGTMEVALAATGSGRTIVDAGRKQPMLLRTHTSPMQIRVMEQRRPPVRVVVPGRCYRFEATDATHESVFFQYEGLAIDEQLSMADLKGVLYSFARQLFGGERRVRFRPDYFPFTEPSAEIAFDCFVCEGSGTTDAGRCATCGGSGWIEAAGCGMVHPEALRRVGYDPAKVQGFAFGGGVERLAMLLTGTPDIRLFHQNDLRYLESL
ncbi:MAG: phenylalanine--tRNA ligase subunit alpha [Chloroflexota bacterium]|nr:phenylalanine--tRNA ligase subunit alpha [Chloroflexota bacterium]MDE3103214.1 phenylalanine--tRNA ligase subunit alpha [Chloroflexota bacterium]